MSLDARMPRIVLIDDDPVLTRAVARNLRRYDLVAFQDPQAAFGYILADIDVSVVITDIQMPRWSGIDFYRNVSEEVPELADRFVFITGQCQDDPFFTSRVHRIVKPFGAEELTTLIERIASKPKARWGAIGPDVLPAVSAQ